MSLDGDCVPPAGHAAAVVPDSAFDPLSAAGRRGSSSGFSPSYSTASGCSGLRSSASLEERLCAEEPSLVQGMSRTMCANRWERLFTVQDIVHSISVGVQYIIEDTAAQYIVLL